MSERSLTLLILWGFYRKVENAGHHPADWIVRTGRPGSYDQGIDRTERARWSGRDERDLRLPRGRCGQPGPDPHPVRPDHGVRRGHHGLFALGAYLGRNLSGGWAIVSYIVAFVCLIAMNFTVRRSPGLTVGLLFAVGILLGLGLAPTLSYYAAMDPQALWQAGGATALFIAGFGAAGYATRRDLAVVGRISFFALIALIVFGIVLIFVHIPHGDLIYSILGLVIFAGPDHVRLPAAAPLQGAGLGPAHRRVDLPRRAQRVPVLPAHLLHLGELSALNSPHPGTGVLCSAA